MANRRRDLEKEQFWRLVMEEHGNSGLNARAFCRRESISEPSFYAWRRKFRDREADPPVVNLMPVEVVDAELQVKQVARQIEVVVAGELVVRLDDDCSSEAMVRVLSAAWCVMKGSAPC